MSQQVPGSWKQCATCAYWTGSRTCDYFGTHVIVNNTMDNGKCMIPSGGWKNADRQATHSCNDYKKWPVLK